ncbi:MAG: peptidoglycan DD-metalloendopeptidase family protein [Parcubacteria group bacterium]
MRLKSILIRLLAGTFRILPVAGNFIVKGFTVFFIYVGRGLFWALVFPSYKGYHLLRIKLTNIFSAGRGKALDFLNKYYFVHVFIAVIGCAIVVNNVGVAKVRDDNFGSTTIIYAILSSEDYEVLTVETAPANQGRQPVSSYMNQAVALNGQKGEGAPGADVLGSGLATITQGGAAVVKPNIIQSAVTGSLALAVPSTRDSIVEYRVKSGDTLAVIARHYGVSVETILWQNQLTVSSRIVPGQILEILPVSGVVHTVVRGQTIGQIAGKYGVEAAKIVSYNALPNAASIRIGQKLIIPGGSKASPYQTAQAVPSAAPIAKLFSVPTAVSRVAASGIIWPTAIHRITQYFSLRHTGLDLGIPLMTPLYAVADGTVVFSGWSTGYGNAVVIDHGNGMKTRYGHQTKLLVSSGDQVDQGQQIGWSGSTGWSTGPHLHFEVIINGVRKNPLAYLP